MSIDNRLIHIVNVLHMYEVLHKFKSTSIWDETIRSTYVCRYYVFIFHYGFVISLMLCMYVCMYECMYVTMVHFSQLLFGINVQNPDKGT